MSSLLSVPIATITALSAEGAVDLVQKILQAECRYSKLSPSALTISERLNVSDGGIDAEVLAAHEIPTDSLFQQGLNGFQLKSGSSFIRGRAGFRRRDRRGFVRHRSKVRVHYRAFPCISGA